MKKIEVDKLITRLIDNSITDEESVKLAQWLEAPDNLRYFNEYIELNHLINSKRKFDHRHSLKEFVKMSQRNNTRINTSMFYVAASVAILISLTFFFTKTDNGNSIDDPKVVNNHIKIGANKATLTLEDGKEVVLEKGKTYVSSNLESTGEDLVYQSKSTGAPRMVYNYLTIPRGGQFHVQLSDGTQVWLNSESKLKYPVDFVEGKPREVELIYGEAYFDVSHSSDHEGANFKVYSGGQEVEVLGTEFNVKAYTDEGYIYTTLVDGSIKLNTNNETHSKLEPEQQSILNKASNNVIVSKVNVNHEIAWKKGLFSFKDKSLKNIMKVLERWYDVDVVFEDEKLEGVLFNGQLSKNQNIENILLLIKGTNKINSYEINSKTIILK